MLIEDYIHSVQIKFNALEFLHETVLYEIIENYSLFKHGNCLELIEKIRTLTWLCSILVKVLKEEREEMRKIMNNDYHNLLKTEP